MLLAQIPNYYKARREALMKARPNSVFLIPSNFELVRNSDVHYLFRQESHFRYLCGLEEPDAFLVLALSKSLPGSFRTILFVRNKDVEKEMWQGERYGVEGALEIFGANEAYPIEELDKRLPELFSGADRVFYRLGLDSKCDARVITALNAHRLSSGRSGKGLLPIEDAQTVIGEMRLFKSPEEIELHRKACQITALAHKTAMQEVRPGMVEHEIEALVDYLFRKNGCDRVAYPSIVAGGKNATCLHYQHNNCVLKDGELLLIDAGGEYQCYAADITRTFPIGRDFSKPQAKLYDLVLKSQKEAVAMTKPGVKLADIHKHVYEVLTDGLLSLGLLQGNREDIIKNLGFKRFFPHNTSHWMGLDVHDAGLYFQDGEPRTLEPGMLFTIEPGLYVQPNDKDAPAEYRDIGIRIEDDVLVTQTGCENLTQEAPKERDEIVALRS
ncbi:aminopeptidase P N-terminal domain-containing protein [Bdellovibrionota bacterium FG-2]